LFSFHVGRYRRSTDLQLPFFLYMKQKILRLKIYMKNNDVQYFLKIIFIIMRTDTKISGVG